MSDNWKELVKAVAATKVKHSSLKAIALAQWALESGWGESDLAQKHNNYAGLKYRQRMKNHAKPVDYLASDGEDTYCEFSSIEAFIKGYWHFIDSGPYDEWESYSDNPLGYIRYIREIGYAEDPDYIAKVRNLLDEVNSDLQNTGEEPDVEAHGPTADSSVTKVAVIVGHNKSSKGAYSGHLMVSEWVYNQRIAEYMHDNGANLNIVTKTFLRTPGGGYKKEIERVYKKVNNWGPDLAIELHFNAGGGNGSEMLYWHKSDSSKILARSVQNEVMDVLELKNRGLKARKQGDRGWRSLVAANGPVILAEPFFGDSITDCNKMMEIGEKRLARAYLRGLRHAAELL